MARSKGAVYSGKLVLDKITGIRHDKGQKATPIQSLVKPSTELPTVAKSMKTSPNQTPNGEKY